MNREELRDIVRRFCKVEPGFTEWRSNAAKKQAAANGTTSELEWSDQLDSWERTLGPVSVAEAIIVMGRFERDEIDIPTYGDFARSILREVKQQRNYAADRTRNSDSGGQRYQCNICWDRGLVRVWNPSFVAAYESLFAFVNRSEYDRRQPAGINLAKYDPDGNIKAWTYEPSDWLGAARTWWIRRQSGPMQHMALCNCDCPRRRRLLEERDKHYAGTRAKNLTWPACGAADYVPAMMPLATGDDYGDLEKWYSEENTL